jgi:hypothetical protein
MLMAIISKARLTLKHKTVLEEARKAEALVAKAFRQANFTVQVRVGSRGREYDLLATRMELGRLRRYAIDIKVRRQPVPRDDVARTMAALRDDAAIDEVWLIGNAFTPDAIEGARRWGPGIRLLTFDEFEGLMSSERSRKNGDQSASATRQARTIIGRSVVANREPILLACAALLKLIEEKLASLYTQLPNSDEGISERDQSIADYERLRSDLVALVESIKEFEKGAAAERSVVKTTKSFAEGVKNWWTKSHDKICEKTYDMGLFGSAVAICSMAGAGGKLAVIASAALIGGKSVTNVLKEVARKVAL